MIEKKKGVRILFLIDTLQTGGAERSLLQIITRFKKYHPIVVLLFNKNHDLKQEYLRAGIEIIELNLPDTLAFWKLARLAAPKLHGVKSLLVHSTLFKSDMTSRYLSNSLQVPVINSFVNNSYSRVRYRLEPWSIKFKLWLFQQWDALTAKRVAAFVSNSEAIKRTNVKALRILPEKVRVIYRGRTADSFVAVNSAQRDELRHSLQASNKRVFLNVSRLLDRKGQLDLIHAFADVVNDSPNCVLWIAGEGSYRPALEKAIAQLNLEAHVRLLGNRNDVPQLLAAADYFVFPSHYEGLPGSLIEAMFARIPIIASDIPENLECVNSNMALLHKAGDVRSLSMQMRTALGDESWSTRTQLTFEYASIHFNIDKIAEAYEQLYDEVIQNSNLASEEKNLH